MMVYDDGFLLSAARGRRRSVEETTTIIILIPSFSCLFFARFWKEEKTYFSVNLLHVIQFVAIVLILKLLLFTLLFDHRCCC